MIRRPPRSTLFPSTTLSRSVQGPNVREVGDFDFSADPVAMMYEHFARQIEIAMKNGVEKIFIDPGLGFYYRHLQDRSEEHTSGLQSQSKLACRLLHGYKN